MAVEFDNYLTVLRYLLNRIFMFDLLLNAERKIGNEININLSIYLKVHKKRLFSFYYILALTFLTFCAHCVHEGILSYRIFFLNKLVVAFFIDFGIVSKIF